MTQFKYVHFESKVQTICCNALLLISNCQFYTKHVSTMCKMFLRTGCLNNSRKAF